MPRGLKENSIYNFVFFFLDAFNVFAREYRDENVEETLTTTLSSAVDVSTLTTKIDVASVGRGLVLC